MSRDSFQRLFEFIARPASVADLSVNPSISSLKLKYFLCYLLAQNTRFAAAFNVKKYHSIIRESEKPIGEADRHEFKAETKMLLDIVAKSLYSENEVFIRELISNSSDAIEKFRYIANTTEPNKIVESDRKLEIHIETNKQDMKLIIQDKGIGMTKEELIDSLGTIAKSGSKSFMQQLQNSEQPVNTNIIGQFGVGFYSVSSYNYNVLEVFKKLS